MPGVTPACNASRQAGLPSFPPPIAPMSSRVSSKTAEVPCFQPTIDGNKILQRHVAPGLMYNEIAERVALWHEANRQTPR
jgi:hypothetical protein